jgi:hypothetical protein
LQKTKCEVSITVVQFLPKNGKCIFRFFKSPQIKFHEDCFSILAVLHADKQNDEYGESVRIIGSVILNFYFVFLKFYVSRRPRAVILETFDFYFANFGGTGQYWSNEVSYSSHRCFSKGLGNSNSIAVTSECILTFLTNRILQ